MGDSPCSRSSAASGCFEQWARAVGEIRIEMFGTAPEVLDAPASAKVGKSLKVGKPDRYQTRLVRSGPRSSLFRCAPRLQRR